MSAVTVRIPGDSESESSKTMELTLRACDVAKSAVSHVADGLAKRAAGPFAAASDCEKELDRLDQEIDDRVTLAISGASPMQARELLACLKCMIDLERIGDLVSSVGGRAQAIGARVEMEDIRELIHIATALEQMLVDVHAALANRDLDRAISVLRSDSEIDRLRNLVFMRHVENREGAAGPEGVQVLFMTQALERAGDHAKNIAEEVCHLVSGRSVRHLMRANSKSDEQMFIDWLRAKQVRS